MKKGDLLFVYGTLRPGKGANGFLREQEHIGETRISGKLYNLGWYPGVKIEGEGRFISEGPTVKGDLYRLTDESITSRLDSYEGYPNLYDRKKVETESGETTWVYEYNHGVSEERLVPAGEWE